MCQFCMTFIMRFVLAVCCLVIAAFADDSVSSRNDVTVEFDVPNPKKYVENIVDPKAEVIVELSLPKFLRRVDKEKAKQAQKNLNTLKDKWFGKKVKLDLEAVGNKNEGKCAPTSMDDTKSKQTVVESSAEAESKEDDSSSSSEDENSRTNIPKPKSTINIETGKAIKKKEQVLKNLKQNWLGGNSKLQVESERTNYLSKSLPDKKTYIKNVARDAGLHKILEEVAKEVELKEELEANLGIKELLKLPSENKIEFDVTIPKLDQLRSVDQLREKLEEEQLISLKNKWSNNIPAIQVDLNLEKDNVNSLNSNCPEHTEKLDKTLEIDNAKKLGRNWSTLKEETLNLGRIAPSKGKVGLEIAIPNFKRSFASSKLKSGLKKEDLETLKNKLDLELSLSNDLGLMDIEDDFESENKDLKQTIKSISLNELIENLDEKKDDLKENSEENSFSTDEAKLEINIPNVNEFDKVKNLQIRRRKQHLLALKEKWLKNKSKLNGKVDFDIHAKLTDLESNLSDIDDDLSKLQTLKEIISQNNDHSSKSITHISPEVANIDLVQIEAGQNTPETNESNDVAKKSKQSNKKPSIELEFGKMNLKSFETKLPKGKDNLRKLVKNGGSDDLNNLLTNLSGELNIDNEVEIPLESQVEIDISIPQIKNIQLGSDKRKAWRNKQDLAALKGKWLGKKPKLDIDLNFENTEGKDSNRKQVENEHTTTFVDEIDLEIELPILYKDFGVDRLKTTRNKQDLEKLKSLNNNWLGKDRKLKIDLDSDNIEKYIDEQEVMEEQKKSCSHKTAGAEVSSEAVDNNSNEKDLSDEQFEVDIHVPYITQANKPRGGKARRNRPDLKALKEKLLRKKSKLGIDFSLSGKTTLADLKQQLGDIDLEKIIEIEELIELEEELSHLKEENKELVSDTHENDLKIELNIEKEDGTPSENEFDVQINIPSFKQSNKVKVAKNIPKKQDLATLKNKWLGKKGRLEINLNLDNELVLEKVKENQINRKDSLYNENEDEENKVEVITVEGPLEDKNQDYSINFGKVHNLQFEIPNMKESFEIRGVKAKRNRPDLKTLKDKLIRKKSKLGINFDISSKTSLADLKEQLANINLENIEDIDDLIELEVELSDLKDDSHKFVTAKKKDLFQINEYSNVDFIKEEDLDGQQDSEGQKQGCNHNTAGAEVLLEAADNNSNEQDLSDEQFEVDINVPDITQAYKSRGGKARRNLSDLKALKEKLLRKKTKLGIDFSLSGKTTLGDLKQQLSDIDLEKIIEIEELIELEEELSHLKKESKKLISDTNENDVKLELNIEKKNDMISENEIDVHINIPTFKESNKIKKNNNSRNKPNLTALKNKFMGKKGKLEINLQSDNEVALKEVREKLINKKDCTDNRIEAEGEEDKSEEASSVKDSLEEYENIIDVENPIDINIELPNLKKSIDIREAKGKWNRPGFKSLKDNWSKNKLKVDAEIKLAEENLEGLKEKWTINKKEINEFTAFDGLKERLDSSKPKVEILVPDFEHLRTAQKDSDSIKLEELNESKANKGKKGKFVKLKEIVTKTISQGKTTLENDWNKLKEELEEKKP